MRVVIAIHDRPVWALPAVQVARIVAARPHDTVVHVEAETDRLPAVATADVLFAYRLSDAEFAAARHLRMIQSPSVGVGGLLRPAVVADAVSITNTRGVHSRTIAEHALALTLSLRRNLHTAVRRQLAHEWRQEEVGAGCGAPLSETRLLVIGVGTIGAEVARMAAALGMTVTGVRRRGDQPTPPGVDQIVPLSHLDDALAEADVIVVTAPSTPDSRGLISRAALGRVKPTAILVNVSRGELVDEEALIDALASGRLAAAGLDVFQEEPLPASHRFWDLPNLLISPHIAGLSSDFWTPVVDLFIENLGRFEDGQLLKNLVDKRAGY